jgi:hypothetical protein
MQDAQGQSVRDLQEQALRYPSCAPSKWHPTSAIRHHRHISAAVCNLLTL